MPGLNEDSLRTVLLRAALFGLITYGTYDLTNLATVKDWPELFASDLSNAIFEKDVWTFTDGVLTASKDRAIWTKPRR